MSESYPTRPGDIPSNATLVDLAEEITEHQLALLAHRHGNKQLDAAQLRTVTLATLACRTALATEAAEARWMFAADALSAGATVEEVGAAMGVHPDDLPVFLASWAAEQRRLRLITDERYDEVLALVAGEVQS